MAGMLSQVDLVVKFRYSHYFPLDTVSSSPLAPVGGDGGAL
jgi:hypothetical protein